MPRKLRKVTRDDIMDMAEYGRQRAEMRKALMAIKKLRRIAVGPDATFHFESYETMWHQVHEMLFVEKGGEEQIKDELSAYNPLIPQGDELVVTLMFEIDDKARRGRLLGSLGGVEATVFLRIGREKITAQAEQDVARTNAAGKASAVQFLHFLLSEAQIKVFKDPLSEVVLGIGHKAYRHTAVIGADAREELVRDFT